MKRSCIISLFCLCLLNITGKAQKNVNEIYSATLHEVNGHAPSFVFSDGSFESTFLGAIENTDVTVTMPCGVNCNGTYYGFLTKGGTPYKLVTVDWDAAKTTDVVSLPEDYPLFFDIAYNFHTGKVYAALNNIDGNTVLYEVNVNDGKYVEVANLDIQARAIDFSFDGTLYALTTKQLDSYGTIINVLTLASYDSGFTLKEQKQVFDDYSSYLGVYDTGTYNAFSMEFDYLSGVLYYTQTDSKQQYAYSIDVKEGKRLTSSFMLGSDPTYSQNFDALSLYIPFIAPDGGINSAAPVTNLQTKADSGGALKATLTWINPTVNFNNVPLIELYSIRIYRKSVSDGNLLAEITENVTVGGEMSWTDENASQGNNTYVLIPCRVNGEKGLAATVSVFTGLDIPGPVESVILETVLGGIKVSWQKPSTTQNGGVLDENTLKYTVVRMPDELIVKTDITETSFVDANPLPEWKDYSYMITAKTATGESKPSDGWARIYAGPAFMAPYETTFDDDKANGLWKSYNKNEDGFDGYFDSYSGMFSISAVYYDEDAIKNLNTWLISPTINLMSGQYKITVESYINKANFANSFDIAYGTEQTVEAQSNNLGSFNYSSTADAQTNLAETFVNIPTDGDYNFSVHMNGAKLFKDYDRCALGIGFFKIEFVGKIPPAEENFKLTGTVIDNNELAIQSAKITVIYGDKTFESETGATGEFTVDVTGIRDVYDMTIAKEGFNAVNDQFTYAGEDIIALGNITLTPILNGINNIIYDADGNAEIKIYDLSGRLIETMTISKGENLNIAKGVYIINGVKHAVE